MSDLSAGDVERHWALAPPVRLRPVATGTNNRSFVVDTGAGPFFLKSVRNTAAPDRIRFEHALLRALAGMGLPFAVPVPIASRSGASAVPLHAGTDAWLSALTPVIPGRAARYGSVSDAVACGEALARLAIALASVRVAPGIAVPDTYGDVTAVHPQIANAESAFQRRLPPDIARALVASMAATGTEWSRRVAGLPMQVIHADYYPANVLMRDGRVTGVLDFEFAGAGYRVMDLAIGLVAFALKAIDHPGVWPLAEAFAVGYLRLQPLPETELAAVPVMLRLRELTSVLHRLGRLEQGVESLDDLEDRARHLLALDRWLDRHQDRLVDRLWAIGTR